MQVTIDSQGMLKAVHLVNMASAAESSALPVPHQLFCLAEQSGMSLTSFCSEGDDHHDTALQARLGSS